MRLVSCQSRLQSFSDGQSVGISCKEGLTKALDGCNRYLLTLKRECESGFQVLPQVGGFELQLQRLSTELDKYLEQPVPEEILNLAVYTDGNEVYLLRKSERYWKGLWTLPQLRDEEAEQSEEVLPVIEHRLTHLLLRIYPVRLSIPSKIPAAWKAFTKEQIKTEALPTPIRKLLLEVL